MVSYTVGQTDVLTWIIITGSVLSMIGALFIILNYCLITSLRNKFAFKLLLWVAITDLIDAVGSIVPVDYAGFACTLQAMTKQFGDNASLYWVVAISWTIYDLTKLTKIATKPELNKLLKRMHIIIWSVAIITTILPLTTNSYGVAGGWCWIKEEYPSNIWRYITFYVPLWIGIIYMIYIYVKVWKKLKIVHQHQHQQQQQQQHDEATMDSVEITETVDANDKNENTENEKENDDKNARRKNNTLQRMKYYPMILIICYFFASIRRITDDIVDGHAPFVLAVLHFTFESLIGFGDGIAYGLTPEIKQKDKELIENICKCNKSTIDMDNHQNEDEIR